MLDVFSAEMLARIQFAFTVSFHIIFPAFSIGLASYLAVLKALWMRTRDETYLTLFNYWKKIFAVAFGMGVVSGIVMSYQFGTNWSVFSDLAGPVVGPLMAYEVLSAFFLEAGFLGIMLFGRERVGEKLHMFATAMVAFGTLMSATWILSVNSWMQTPAGFSINEVGQFVPEDWWQIVFNPSFPYRLAHMVLAAFLTTALVVGAVGAVHLLRDKTDQHARRMFSMAMWMAFIVTPIQIFAGHEHGLNTLELQPVKIMAMEGHYESHPEGWAPLYLFGIPNDAEQRLDYTLSIPGLGNLIFEKPLDKPVMGLDTVPDEDQPPVGIVFWSFRVMVGLGFVMLGLGVWSAWSRWRGTLFDAPWLLRASILMGPTGFVAVLAGWITTEVGRQPYTVYGFLRTSDSLAPVDAPAVATSLVAFIIVYFAVFGAGTVYILRMMNKPPATPKLGLRDGPIRTAGITPAPQVDPDFIPGE
ncbi:cytochrome ubiquinol oxidase subunit I [Roseobacter denitrificans]|uniref:Cytochrome oxidase subunit II, putative n=1 Tax=Roseobacter denitrificans (strain ATCC 33942 / OCh 114) TaxID=375451 RepID=Q16C22_ROSDO|nr:cytochrome ubiquinol oxidase subunit I [Roseobacter denitrificans]ABG30471.1 cytochrome oxidase subunit II, putative [Roseobacter denitrificans OCh 114]AVL53624.1 cytochrome ubiquinol oxidase subunit I [Roseobacter denitrificans]SFF73178.1 cytochrome bd-I ubiquinol oxidase subunit 1 apoprotein [Roseobacter denitrificans OCh 114]